MSKDKKKPAAKPTATPTPPEEDITQAAERVAPAETEDMPVIDMDALRHEVEGILKERDEYLRALQQVSADFENYKKRNAQLRADVEADTRRAVIASMLPVLDNLERALALPAEQAGAEGLFKGVELVQKQFLTCLESLSVEEIPAEPGTPFDPTVHDAVATAPADEHRPDNTVYDILQKGYRIGERIIRHSVVRVAQK